jgi:hypothetical protein
VRAPRHPVSIPAPLSPVPAEALAGMHMQDTIVFKGVPPYLAEYWARRKLERRDVDWT